MLIHVKEFFEIFKTVLIAIVSPDETLESLKKMQKAEEGRTTN